MVIQPDSIFRLWRKEIGFTPKESADYLGRSLRQVRRYDAGVKEPDRVVRLAMSALLTGLHPYENSTTRTDSIAA